MERQKFFQELEKTLKKNIWKTKIQTILLIILMTNG